MVSLLQIMLLHVICIYPDFSQFIVLTYKFFLAEYVWICPILMPVKFAAGQRLVLTVCTSADIGQETSLNMSTSPVGYTKRTRACTLGVPE